MSLADTEAALPISARCVEIDAASGGPSVGHPDLPVVQLTVLPGQRRAIWAAVGFNRR